MEVIGRRIKWGFDGDRRRERSVTSLCIARGTQQPGVLPWSPRQNGDTNIAYLVGTSSGFNEPELGQAQWLTTIIGALREAKVGGS